MVRRFPVLAEKIVVAAFCKEFIVITIMIMIMNLPPHSASSKVVDVVITLLPSDFTQLRSLMGQVEPGNTFISWKSIIYELQILNINYILLVAVLELLGAGTAHCGGSSIGTAVEVEVEEDVVAVEVEVDGARITVLKY